LLGGLKARRRHKKDTLKIGQFKRVKGG